LTQRTQQQQQLPSRLVDHSCQTDSELFSYTPSSAPTGVLKKEKQEEYHDNEEDENRRRESFDSLDIRSITPTTIDSIALPPEMMSSYTTSTTTNTSCEDLDLSHNPKINFQEFIRLKRENLSLRVLVSELPPPSPTSMTPTLVGKHKSTKSHPNTSCCQHNFPTTTPLCLFKSSSSDQRRCCNCCDQSFVLVFCHTKRRNKTILLTMMW
jgi:hypothetical protein